MNRIAFLIADLSVYWSSVILALAAAAAVCLFLGLYLKLEGDALAASLAVPAAMLLSLFFGRLLHWYCQSDSYESLGAALADVSFGRFALMGAFAGCALAALLLRVLRLCRNLPRMLDCMSIAGAGGIAVGRLASFYDTSARGPLTGLTELPLAYPVTNAVSGLEEFRIAIFLLQAAVTGVIFISLLARFFRERHRKDGDITLIFLLCHGAAQVLLDSTRYDSLFFRSNGFVSIVQVLGAVGIGLAAILFSVRLVRQQGFKARYIGLWAAFAALLGLAGYMEYYLQRHGDRMLICYIVMGTALSALVALVLTIRRLADRKRV